MVSPININNFPIKFSSSAEHVGVVRSNSGNLPHIWDIISSHKKALFAILPAGLSRKKYMLSLCSYPVQLA